MKKYPDDFEPEHILQDAMSEVAQYPPLAMAIITFYKDDDGLWSLGLKQMGPDTVLLGMLERSKAMIDKEEGV